MEIIDRIIEKSKTNSEITPLIYDIMRTITIQLTVQIMFYINNSEVSVISPIFIQTTLFLILGTIIFWLIVYKLFSRSSGLKILDDKDE